MNRQEAEELLPWFVAGALDAEETRAVQAFIDSGEISAEELESVSALATTVAASAADEPAYDPGILSRAMTQLDGIEQDPAPEPLVVRETSAEASGAGEPGLLQRLLDRLQWSATPPLARVLVAGQFALLIGLAVILSGGEQETVSETVAGPGIAAEAAVSLSFLPTTPESEIRALLLENGATIVAGPSALGLYQVAISSDADREAAIERLRDDARVQYLQELPKP
jgi:anti-sigma factor RsiW